MISLKRGPGKPLYGTWEISTGSILQMYSRNTKFIVSWESQFTALQALNDLLPDVKLLNFAWSIWHLLYPWPLIKPMKLCESNWIGPYPWREDLFPDQLQPREILIACSSVHVSTTGFRLVFKTSLSRTSDILRVRENYCMDVHQFIDKYWVWKTSFSLALLSIQSKEANSFIIT